MESNKIPIEKVMQMSLDDYIVARGIYVSPMLKQSDLNQSEDTDLDHHTEEIKEETMSVNGDESVVDLREKIVGKPPNNEHLNTNSQQWRLIHPNNREIHNRPAGMPPLVPNVEQPEFIKAINVNQNRNWVKRYNRRGSRRGWAFRNYVDHDRDNSANQSNRVLHGRVQKNFNNNNNNNSRNNNNRNNNNNNNSRNNNNRNNNNHTRNNHYNHNYNNNNYMGRGRFPNALHQSQSHGTSFQCDSGTPPINTIEVEYSADTFASKSSINSSHCNEGSPQISSSTNVGSGNALQSLTAFGSALDLSNGMKLELMPIIAQKILEQINNAQKEKYDMKVQKEIHGIQGKALTYKCPGGTVISSDGPGLANCKLTPSSTGLTMNQRFA